MSPAVLTILFVCLLVAFLVLAVRALGKGKTTAAGIMTVLMVFCGIVVTICGFQWSESNWTKNIRSGDILHFTQEKVYITVGRVDSALCRWKVGDDFPFTRDVYAGPLKVLGPSQYPSGDKAYVLQAKIDDCPLALVVSPTTMAWLRKANKDADRVAARERDRVDGPAAVVAAVRSTP